MKSLVSDGDVWPRSSETGARIIESLGNSERNTRFYKCLDRVNGGTSLSYEMVRIPKPKSESH
jgi:hypothetical protein